MWPRSRSAFVTTSAQWQRAPLVMKILRPLTMNSIAFASRHGRDARHVGARVRLGDGQRRDLLALDRRHEPRRFCSSVPNLNTGGVAISAWTATAMPRPPQPSLRHLLREHHGREVVATLAAVLGRVAEAQEAQLAEPLEDRVREGLLLPLVQVGLNLLLQELPDVQPQLFVGVGEVHCVPSLSSGGGVEPAYGMIRRLHPLREISLVYAPRIRGCAVSSRGPLKELDWAR